MEASYIWKLIKRDEDVILSYSTREERIDKVIEIVKNAPVPHDTPIGFEFLDTMNVESSFLIRALEMYKTSGRVLLLPNKYSVVEEKNVTKVLSYIYELCEKEKNRKPFKEKEMKITKLYFAIITTFLLCGCAGRINEAPKVDSLEIYRKVKLDIEVKDALKGTCEVDTEERAIGKYLYIDRNYCLHTNINCLSLLREDAVILCTSDDDAQLISRNCKYVLHRIKKDALSSSNLAYCCRECVDDEMYEQLQALVNDNN